MRIEHDPDSGCYECPFYRERTISNADGDGHDEIEPDACTAKAFDFGAWWSTSTAPSWCPLRGEDVTVTREVSE